MSHMTIIAQNHADDSINFPSLSVTFARACYAFNGFLVRNVRSQNACRDSGLWLNSASGAESTALQNLLHNIFWLPAEDRGFVTFALRSSAHHLKPKDSRLANVVQLELCPGGFREGLSVYHYSQLALLDA